VGPPTRAVANQSTDSSVPKVAKMRNKPQIKKFVCFIAVRFVSKVTNK